MTSNYSGTRQYNNAVINNAPRWMHAIYIDVFRNFERDGNFFGFIGQSNQAVTGMYNLNRASHLIFSGEEILEQAKSFSYDFLREKQASNQLLDKWVIAKDLPGEVAYALDFPFYASLPRIEARWYIDQYGGGDDVWIGKTLYRMLYVNNAVYLDLAKVDFNQCQAVHQREWLGLQRWYEECRLKEYGMQQKSVLRAYFLATASIFELDRSAERLGWARTAVLAEAVSSYANDEVRHSFIKDYPSSRQNQRSGWNPIWDGRLVGHILGLLDLVATMPGSTCRLKPPDQVFRRHLRRAWEEWLLKLQEGEGQDRCWLVQGEIALLLIRTIELCAGRIEPDGEVARLEYACLARLAISICGQLRACMRVPEGNMIRTVRENDIESEMQELVKCVLQPQSPNGLNNETKQTFLAIVKSFYYMARCPSSALNNHITKVLFEPVE